MRADRSLRWWALGLLAPLVGCIETSGNPPTPPNCMGDPTMAAIQDGIFSRSCAFGSCHAGANPAASLDLSAGHACANLVEQKTCVFNNRMRVVPGHPEQSYLLNKLSGQELGDDPDGPCAVAANGHSQRMPLGGEPMCQGRVDQVRAWIAAGARCDTPPPDGGGDSGGGGTDGGTDAGVDTRVDPDSIIDSLASAASTIHSGSRITVQAYLRTPAPSQGQAIFIQVFDPTALTAPAQVFVPGGATSASFDVAGLRPARPTLLRARSGGGWADLRLAVDGLWLAEVFYDAVGADDGLEWVEIMNTGSVPVELSGYSLGAGSTNYVYTKAQLEGTVPPGGCAVIGGPLSTAANGMPLLTQSYNFNPDLPNGGGGNAAGIALFDARATDVDAATLPIDAVIYGAANTGGLRRPDGSVGSPDSPGAPAGSSLRRSGPSSWAVQSPLRPNQCPNL